MGVEEEVLNLVNALRVEKGVPPLALDRATSDAAKKEADHLAVLSSVSPSDVARQGKSCYLGAGLLDVQTTLVAGATRLPPSGGSFLPLEGDDVAVAGVALHKALVAGSAAAAEALAHPAATHLALGFSSDSTGNIRLTEAVCSHRLRVTSVAGAELTASEDGYRLVTTGTALAEAGASAALQLATTVQAGYTLCGARVLPMAPAIAALDRATTVTTLLPADGAVTEAAPVPAGGAVGDLIDVFAFARSLGSGAAAEEAAAASAPAEATLLPVAPWELAVAGDGSAASFEKLAVGAAHAAAVARSGQDLGIAALRAHRYVIEVLARACEPPAGGEEAGAAAGGVPGLTTWGALPTSAPPPPTAGGSDDAGVSPAAAAAIATDALTSALVPRAGSASTPGMIVVGRLAVLVRGKAEEGSGEGGDAADGWDAAAADDEDADGGGAAGGAGGKANKSRHQRLLDEDPLAALDSIKAAMGASSVAPFSGAVVVTPVTEPAAVSGCRDGCARIDNVGTYSSLLPLTLALGGVDAPDTVAEGGLGAVTSLLLVTGPTIAAAKANCPEGYEVLTSVNLAAVIHAALGGGGAPPPDPAAGAETAVTTGGEGAEGATGVAEDDGEADAGTSGGIGVSPAVAFLAVARNKEPQPGEEAVTAAALLDAVLVAVQGPESDPAAWAASPEGTPFPHFSAPTGYAAQYVDMTVVAGMSPMELMAELAAGKASELDDLATGESEVAPSEQSDEALLANILGPEATRRKEKKSRAGKGLEAALSGLDEDDSGEGSGGKPAPTRRVPVRLGLFTTADRVAAAPPPLEEGAPAPSVVVLVKDAPNTAAIVEGEEGGAAAGGAGSGAGGGSSASSAPSAVAEAVATAAAMAAEAAEGMGSDDEGGAMGALLRSRGDAAATARTARSMTTAARREAYERHRAQLLELLQAALAESSQLMVQNGQLQKQVAIYLSLRDQGQDELLGKDDGEEGASAELAGLSGAASTTRSAAAAAFALADKEKRFREQVETISAERARTMNEQARLDALAADLRLKAEEKELRCAQLSKALKEFKAEVCRSAISPFTGLRIPKETLERIEAQEAAKDEELARMQLKSIHLQRAISKLESQVRRREQVAEGLSLLDFEQLKIENSTLSEKIDARESEIDRLRKKTQQAVQVLTHVREKFQFVQSETTRIKAELEALEREISAQRTAMAQAKKLREDVRLDNERAKDAAGPFRSSDALAIDFERRKRQVAQLQREVGRAQARHEALLHRKSLIAERSAVLSGGIGSGTHSHNSSQVSTHK